MLKKLFGTLRKPRGSAQSGRATILDADQLGLQPEQFSRNAMAVASRLQDAGHQAFLVGGCVRDALLGTRPQDFDVATSATPEQVHALFRGSRIIGRRFKLVHVRYGREIIEVATFRSQHADANDADAASNSSGRILRDNVYGTLEEDAQRRDFTINALYYDPVRNQVHAFAKGVDDLRSGVLRLIGEPTLRYQEDPVRMLRAARFAAKLGFRLDERTAAPLRQLSGLLNDIPSARLYDEAIKLFMSGHAEATYEQLIKYQLFKPLFPASHNQLKHGGPAEQLIRLVLRNTDARLAQGKPVTPAFLFAALLWPAVLPRVLQLQASGMPPMAAIQKAGQQVTQQQIQHTALPKRFSLPMQEIWALQERLPQRQGKRALLLVDNPRFRAGYDFLLLREEAGELPQGLGHWWTLFQAASEAERHAMIAALGSKSGERRSRKPRKRKPRNTSGGGNA